MANEKTLRATRLAERHTKSGADKKGVLEGEAHVGLTRSAQRVTHEQ